MEGFKSALNSRTVWSGIIALAGAVLNAFGYELGAADSEALVEAIGGVMTAIGSVGAIFFRVKATKKIV